MRKNFHISPCQLINTIYDRSLANTIANIANDDDGCKQRESIPKLTVWLPNEKNNNELLFNFNARNLFFYFFIFGLSFFLFLLVSHISYIFNHDRLIENDLMPLLFAHDYNDSNLFFCYFLIMRFE